MSYQGGASGAAAPAAGATSDDDDDFGCFTGAERLSDPYADVYGAPLDQAASSFSSAAAPHIATTDSSSPSLLSFSPLGVAPTSTPELTVSPRSLADPFADIVASASAYEARPAPVSAATSPAELLSFSPLVAPMPSTVEATSAPVSTITSPAELLSFSPLAAPMSQSVDPTPAPLSTATPAAELLSFSSVVAPMSGAVASPLSDRANIGSAIETDGSDWFSSGSTSANFSAVPSRSEMFLPPPRSADSATSTTMALSQTENAEVSVGDLLSFSPVAADKSASQPFADVFGASTEESSASAIGAFGDDDLFSLMPDPQASSTIASGEDNSAPQSTPDADAEFGSFSQSFGTSRDAVEAEGDAFRHDPAVEVHEDQSVDFGDFLQSSSLPNDHIQEEQESQSSRDVPEEENDVALRGSAIEVDESQDIDFGDFLQNDPLPSDHFDGAINAENDTGSFIEAHAGQGIDFGEFPQSEQLPSGHFDGAINAENGSGSSVDVHEGQGIDFGEFPQSEPLPSNHILDAVEVENGISHLGSFVEAHTGQGIDFGEFPQNDQLSRDHSQEDQESQTLRDGSEEETNVAHDGSATDVHEDQGIVSEEETRQSVSLSSDFIEEEQEFGDFGNHTTFSAHNEDNNDGFGDFAASSSNGVGSLDEDDFGDFSAPLAASTGPHEGFAVAGSGDSVDDFGDFSQNTGFDEGGDDDFGDFTQSSAAANQDDDFGDFSAPAAASSGRFASVEPMTPLPATSDEELDAFFTAAFKDVSDSTSLTLPAIAAEDSEACKNSVVDTANIATVGVLADVLCSSVESFVARVNSAAPTPAADKPRRSHGVKYLKYVLMEKIQEASQQDGIFPHGSEKHQAYLTLAESGEPAKMRDALAELQDALFHNAINNAMMRIARQAALSAKAKIAEQAAQQQANAKGSSLLATTRQLLLSRNGGGSSSGSSSHGQDRTASGGASSSGSLGVLTPTGASVHKLSRYSFGHDDSAGGNDSEAKSEVPKRRHSGSSEADVASAGSSSRASSFGGVSGGVSGSGSGSGSGNSGLMRKFQDRFSSFSSSRHKTRVVSLRRMGQSGEDVRSMELNMDSISGGMDEVKWKCALFLYDVEEVSHVAPSQIKILSYPGNQVLSSKSDRSALMKFLKPGAIWTIDIGASNNDMLNEW